MDAGSSADAGPLASLTLQVAANPNSVLSAQATVSWSGDLQSITIRFEAADAGQTPAFDLSTAASPATEPILGLAASTAYTFQAIGMDAAGDSVASNEVQLTTGPLPAGIPRYTTTGTASGTGLTLIARLQHTGGPDYAVVVDGTGEPVWYFLIPDDGDMHSDFQQQPDGTFTIALPPDAAHMLPLGGLSAIYGQVDVLGNQIHTWTGLNKDGSGNVVDTQAAPITILATDLHDLRLQPDGSALLFGYVEQTLDLTTFGGSATADAYADVLERVEPDGTVVFAWNSTEYVSPSDVDPVATSLTGANIDYTHGNSIEVLSDGNYMISLRSLSQVLKIDSTTGDVLWRLGGAGISSPSSGGPTGDFTFVGDPLNGFSCQHGARELSNGDIIVFDDGNGHTPQESRAVEYALDLNNMTATFVWDSSPSTALYAKLMGYGQRLTNGNTLVAYGEADALEEWGPTGTSVLWSLMDPSHPFGFYRAYRLGSLYAYEAQ